MHLEKTGVSLRDPARCFLKMNHTVWVSHLLLTPVLLSSSLPLLSAAPVRKKIIVLFLDWVLLQGDSLGGQELKAAVPVAQLILLRCLGSASVCQSNICAGACRQGRAGDSVLMEGKLLLLLWVGADSFILPSCQHAVTV